MEEMDGSIFTVTASYSDLEVFQLCRANGDGWWRKLMSEKSPMTTLWVLAYILRFPGEPGEWAAVCREGYATEALARAGREATGNPTGYSLCKVEVKA